MAQVTSNVPAMVHIGEVMLVPGVAAEVPDELLQTQTVKNMLENKMLEVTVDPQVKQAAEDAAKVAAAEQVTRQAALAAAAPKVAPPKQN